MKNLRTYPTTLSIVIFFLSFFVFSLVLLAPGELFKNQYGIPSETNHLIFVLLSLLLFVLSAIFVKFEKVK